MRHTHSHALAECLSNKSHLPWRRCPQNFSLSFILSQSLSIISALVFPLFSHPQFYSLRLSRSMYVAALAVCLPEESYPSLFANNATSLKAAHFSAGPSEAGLSLRQTLAEPSLHHNTATQTHAHAASNLNVKAQMFTHAQRGITHTTQALNKHFLNTSTLS